MVKKKVKSPRSFEERFNIDINYEDVKTKFVKRVKNTIWDSMSFEENGKDKKYQILWDLANRLGRAYESFSGFTRYTLGYYLETLKALEIAYSGIKTKKKRTELEERIEYCISLSEKDLGIKWQKGKFIKKGAKELDEELVNEVLEWINETKYGTVRIPFSRGLQALIEAENNEGRRRDVIRDMYEALEALSMIITGRTKKELSANMEKYLLAAGVTNEYRRILKEYIVYANRIRHATGKNDDVMDISYREVESFVYLTGVFIRLVI